MKQEGFPPTELLVNKTFQVHVQVLNTRLKKQRTKKRKSWVLHKAF